MIKSVLTWTLLGIILFSGLWYFLLKEYDYSISFKSSRVSGDVYQTLLYYPFEEQFENSRITAKIPFQKIIQEVQIDGEQIKLFWNLSEEKDGGSQIIVQVANAHNFQNRLRLLFKKDKLYEDITGKIRDFKSNLENNLKLYKVKVVGKALSPAATCACIPLENELNGKAVDMINNINKLSNFILDSEAEMVAKPRIVVSNWDVQRNIITYDFCFPIANNSYKAPPPGIYIKNFPSVNSLKAIYNGNYMHSHLAWMQLLQYANKNNLEVEMKPLEIFNDNPEMGGDSRHWEAEIYIPLK